MRLRVYITAFILLTTVLMGTDQYYWKSLNGEVLDHYRKGEYNAAEPKARKALALAAEIFGDRHINYCTSLNNLGRVLHRSNQLAEAEKIFSELLTLMDAGRGKTEDYLTVLNNTGELQMKLKKYKAAEDNFLKIVDICSKVKTYDDTLFAALSNMGYLKKRTRDNGAAAEYLEMAIDKGGEIYGRNSWQLKKLMQALGVVYFEQKRFNSAHKLIREREEINSSNSESNYLELNNRGAIYFYQGLTKAAEKNFRLAVRSAPTEEKVTVMLNLATLYYSKGKYRKAVKVLKSAEDFLIKRGRVKSFDNGLIHYKLGQVYTRQHRYIPGERALRNAMEIFKKVKQNDKSQLQTSKALYRLGQLSVSRRLLGRAEDFFNESRKSGLSLGLDKNPYIVGCMSYLRRIYEIRKDKKSVVELYDEEIELCRKKFGENSISLISVLMEKASYLRTEEQFEPALEYLKRAWKASGKINIKAYPVTYLALGELIAQMLKEKGDYMESREYYFMILEGNKKLHGERSMEVGNIMIEIAELSCELRKIAPARRYCDEGVRICLPYMKPGSIYLKSFLNKMSELYKRCGDKKNALIFKAKAREIKMKDEEEKKKRERSTIIQRMERRQR